MISGSEPLSTPPPTTKHLVKKMDCTLHDRMIVRYGEKERGAHHRYGAALGAAAEEEDEVDEEAAAPCTPTLLFLLCCLIFSSSPIA